MLCEALDSFDPEMYSRAPTIATGAFLNSFQLIRDRTFLELAQYVPDLDIRLEMVFLISVDELQVLAAIEDNCVVLLQ